MAAGKEKATVRIINYRLPLDHADDLKMRLARELDLPDDAIYKMRILKRSTDARQERIDFVYTVLLSFEAEKHVIDTIVKRSDVELYYEKEAERLLKIQGVKARPVIVGCGPAGIFAALTLLERGVKPIVIERGERIKDRAATVENFWKSGELNPESNVLFGEGGAGTFSDGKLTTRIKASFLKDKVFETLVDAGADPEILYLSKPHIGTDLLQKIIPAIIDDLKKKGAEFLFNTAVTAIEIENNVVAGVVAGGESIRADHVFLAHGHSSRATYRMLHEKGALLEPKGFAVGLRIEHPQEFIDKAMLGARADNHPLGHADYFYAYKDTESRRGVYTFCMCPGGYIIGCSTCKGQLCTNGMSAYKRSSPWANAAVVVAVQQDDFSGQALGGIRFQEKLEQEAYLLGGENFFAPAQKARDFLRSRNETAASGDIACSYRPGITCVNLQKLLPDFIAGPLQRGLTYFDSKIPGFIDEGLLVGVETRTSSPVRIARHNKTCHSINVKGLIPVGEGSGYAGGIVSSAVDGIKAAMHFDA